MSDLISRQALCEYAFNQKDKSFYNEDGHLLVPVAQFNLYNIYGWSEYHD